MKPLELSQEEFSEFQKFIYEHSGVRVSDRKRILLSNRIRSRLKEGGFADFQSYYQFITSRRGRNELDGFLDVVTTHESFFFRTEKHFDWFVDEFIGEMITRARQDPKQQIINIWSAACSTGEEIYSLAICLAENQFRLRNWELNLLGTDISEQALKEARDGFYKKRGVELVSDKLLKKYFIEHETESRWEVKQEIKQMVEFKKHNLMNKLISTKFDCIFLRNVLIYFDTPSKEVVVKHLTDSLAEGGYLVVGPSEGIYSMLGDLKKHSTFLYQKC